MKFETVIGLEVHAQLLTESKMFCRCSADYASAFPNTHVCPVCLGMPGVLPAINEKAITYTVMTALALNCRIPEFTKFDRKNYPYPDLMKGYQISQYDAPLSLNGSMIIDVDGKEKAVGVTRVHLEEDTAKLVHRTDPEDGSTYSLVDVNRSGVPLMEIVGEPDLRSPAEARQYLIKLRSILRYLGVSTGNMEEGSFRCDANVSIRPEGSQEFGAKVEIKNMNSFRAVQRALEFEVQRQTSVVEQGGTIVQETRGWVEDKGITVSQRSKEFAHDYRYFPEPDLPPLVLARDWIEAIRTHLPELPDARRRRLMDQFELSHYDASLIIENKAFADFFEESVHIGQTKPSAAKAKTAANWMLGDLRRLLGSADLETCRLTPSHLAEMLDLLESGVLSGKTAKTVFEEMFISGKRAATIVQEKGLSQISDEQTVTTAIDKVLSTNPQAAADFRAGKQQALAFLVGQVMKETKGRANPGIVNKILIDKLGQQ